MKVFSCNDSYDASFISDFKDSLSTVNSAIEEADFLAIDGEFSGTVGVAATY